MWRIISTHAILKELTIQGYTWKLENLKTYIYFRDMVHERETNILTASHDQVLYSVLYTDIQ